MSAEPEVVVVHEVQSRVVRVVAPGPQGPRGLDGGVGLGGIPTSFQNIRAGDLLMFDGSNWTNENQTQIIDGGNF